MSPSAPDEPSTGTTYSGTLTGRSINKMTWYEAFAFCIWDGGRLPTEEEWEYAVPHLPAPSEQVFQGYPVQEAA